MYRTLAIIIVLLTLTVLPITDHTASAQPADEQGPVEETPTAEEQTEAKPSGTSSAEVFIPTEEISEDFAVSFPVDI